MRKDPPPGAEWYWVSKRFNIGYQRVTKKYIWRYEIGKFLALSDYRQGGWYIGFPTWDIGIHGRLRNETA